MKLLVDKESLTAYYMCMENEWHPESKQEEIAKDYICSVLEHLLGELL